MKRPILGITMGDAADFGLPIAGVYQKSRSRF